MPTLFALIVSIDQYPNPRHALQGCVNDGMHMHRFLESYCKKMGFNFRPKVLTDSEATRQAIIAGFDHFQEAKEEDCCLFFYSGHGSRSSAPKEFWGSEPDQSLESIVCWDSREPGGHDLMDKELSYLIWQAAADKDLPFVTIMDCCHSGKMRDIDEEIIATRNLRDVGPALPSEQFLGIEHYKKTKSGQLSPPLGRRVHLAAARDTELAKEVSAGGQPRGIFTYCLIEALNDNGPLISYADLMNRVNPRIKNAVRDQSAQLDATHTEDRNLGFLFSRINPERPAYLVSWDKALGWALNVGALHGISVGTPESPTLLEINENGHQIVLETVLPDRSKVRGMEEFDTKRSYIASLLQTARPKDKVANWHQTLALSNPATGIRDAEIEIELFRLKEARRDHEMDDDVPVTSVDWRANPALFPYFQQDLKPAFQLKLSNKGVRPLWVSILYLGSDFSITNQLLPKALLNSGQEIWVQEIVRGQSFRTIPLQIEETYINQAISSVDEYMKVIISTEELNTDFYHQTGGLSRDEETGATRLAGRRDMPEEKDWAAKTIWLRIERTK